MNIRTTLTLAFILSLVLMAQIPKAAAYIPPHEIIFADTTLIPPNRRDVTDQVARQQAESQERRDREHAEMFATQHASAPEEDPSLIGEDFFDEGDIYLEDEFYPDEYYSDELFYDADLYGDLGEEGLVDREFLSVLRALDRIQETRKEEQELQKIALLLDKHGVSNVHSGAPLHAHHPQPLAPTGAGTLLAIVLALIAIYWTVRRAGAAEKMTRVGL